MNDEIFALVNERDEVVGQAPRREVHARHLRHRAVHILVFNSAGEVYLQKRSMVKDLSPGLWDSSCSGHVDAGEDYDTAAGRELGEELGLTVAAVPPRWFRIEACAENRGGVYLGLSLAVRWAVDARSGGDRTRRVAPAGGCDPLGRKPPGGFLPRLPADLAAGKRR